MSLGSGNHILFRDQQAERYQTQALGLALAGDYDEALHMFEVAASTIASPVSESIEGIIQDATIERDISFTFLRQAIDTKDYKFVERARRNMEYAVGQTEPIVNGRTKVEFLFTLDRKDSKRAKREIFAEHGETIALLGRIATASQVMRNVDTRGESDEAVHARNVEQKHYGIAHSLLKLGSNGYYRVSNAMNGARQEQINGQTKQTAVWLGRAATGLAWSLFNDRKNFKQAAYTFVGRLPHLISRDHAIRSVLTKP